jgi:hypothetical protein
MLRKFLLAIVLAAMLTPAGVALADQDLTLGAIGTTSDTYIMAVAWSSIMKKSDSGVSITPLEGGGTVKLLRGVATGKYDIGFIGSPHYINALEGTLKFKKDPAELREKYKDVRALFGITSGMGQYVTRADSDVHAIKDVKGKKVAIGRPGGMAGTVTKTLFETYGLDPENDYSPEYLKYDAALDELRNNRLSVAFLWGGIPHSAAYNFSRQIPIRFLPIDDENYEKFKENMPEGQWYVLREFEPEDLKKAYGEKAIKQDRPSNCWTFQMQVVVHKDMSEDTAYAIVKNFWENIGEVHSASVALSKLNREQGLESLSADLHPGAAKYYKEKGWIN